MTRTTQRLPVSELVPEEFVIDATMRTHMINLGCEGDAAGIRAFAHDRSKTIGALTAERELLEEQL